MISCTFHNMTRITTIHHRVTELMCSAVGAYLWLYRHMTYHMTSIHNHMTLMYHHIAPSLYIDTYICFVTWHMTSIHNHMTLMYHHIAPSLYIDTYICFVTWHQCIIMSPAHRHMTPVHQCNIITWHPYIITWLHPLQDTQINLPSWMKEIDRHLYNNSDAKKMLVGNKLDCEGSRKVDKAAALVSVLVNMG